MKKLVILVSILSIYTASIAQTFIAKNASIRFFSTTPVENIDATTKTAVALLNTSTGMLTFKASNKSFIFPDKLMQEHFNENYMESDKYPNAEFTGTIENMPNLSKDGVYNVNVKGKFTVHGVSKDRTIPSTLTVKGGKITGYSKFMVKCVDHDIEIPKIVLAKIAESIEVTVNCEFLPKE